MDTKMKQTLPKSRQCNYFKVDALQLCCQIIRNYKINVV